MKTKIEINLNANMNYKQVDSLVTLLENTLKEFYEETLFSVEAFIPRSEL